MCRPLGEPRGHGQVKQLQCGSAKQRRGALEALCVAGDAVDTLRAVGLQPRPSPGQALSDSRMENLLYEAESAPRLVGLRLSEDIAYGALYLASDESSFVTGSELVIDGGYTAE